MRSALSRVVFTALVMVLAGVSRVPADEAPEQACAARELRFTNPVYEGADPWVIKRDGVYYLCRTEGNLGVSVWKSDRLTDRGTKRVVWRAPQKGWNTGQVWAPELHHLDGRWYIYYAASDGRNANHRTGVLEARTDDPQGQYFDKGMVYTGDDVAQGTSNRWSIDATPLQLGDRLYLVWSGWPADEDVQYLYIAPMKDPWTVAGNRVRICDNDTYIWERVSESKAQRGLHEAPQVLIRGTRVFIVYSCSGSWEPTYKLGLLSMDRSADPLDPGNWVKHDKPVFTGNDKVLGVGHASFVKSPDGTEDWIVYHSKLSREPGWQRAVSLQRFRWSNEGFPVFGEAVAFGTPLPVPAGETPNRPGGVFRDHFNQDHWDDWVYYGYNRFIWVEDGVLSLGGDPPWGRTNDYRAGEKALVRGFDWADVSVQSRVRVERGDRDAGILFRVSLPAVGYDAQRGYFAGIIPGTDNVVLGKTDGKDWKELALVDHPVETARWYTLRVEVVGDRIQVFVDDELKIDKTDRAFAHGMVGVRVVDTHAIFDDFQVRPMQSGR